MVRARSLDKRTQNLGWHTGREQTCWGHRYNIEMDCEKLEVIVWTGLN